MPTPTARALVGFAAGAIAFLTFHQGMVEALHLSGMLPQGAYRIVGVPPFNVPVVVSLCFWAGLYGMVFSLLRPRFAWPLWLDGVILGFVAAVVGMVIVAPIKGNAIANGWKAWPVARSLLINGFWGLGVGLILPILQPRIGPAFRRPRWSA